MSPVISDPKTTFLQVTPCAKVAKCTLSFHNLTSSRIVEVNQIRTKTTFFIILGGIKQKNKQMLLNPPLDPPLSFLEYAEGPKSFSVILTKYFSSFESTIKLPPRTAEC